MILVVEDNAEVAQTFAAALRDAGYEVEVVDTGAAALERLLSRQYQIAILDLSLPDINGVEVASRARLAGSRTPIMAASGAVPLVDPARLAEANFCAVLGKPLRLSELVETVGLHAL